jgi:VIT1/CCC1 family predicted Fe2+/Mn2+ transporter
MAASNPRAQAGETPPAPMAHAATDGAQPAATDGAQAAATDGAQAAVPGAHPATDGAQPASGGAHPASGSAHPATEDAQVDMHQHRDVSGGWLRPAVFGAMDGLVTNVSLIAGVGGGGLAQRTIVLTGLAGLAAGAFSMAAGEFVSVSSQNELVAAEVEKERFELEHNPHGEQVELAALYKMRGVDPELADEVARQLSRQPEEALAIHVREELGVDHRELPSPYTAAGASLATFAVGAFIPLLPYLLGFSSLPLALLLAAVAAFVGGGLVARITARPFWRGALRQLALAAVAAALTYGIGRLAAGHF